jgi:hypothetical protein
MCQGCRARGWQETEGSPEEIGSLLEYGRELELGQYVRRPICGSASWSTEI